MEAEVLKGDYEAEAEEGRFQNDQRQLKRVFVRQKDQFLITKLLQCRCVCEGQWCVYRQLRCGRANHKYDKI